jgi:hypothetical protein
MSDTPHGGQGSGTEGFAPPDGGFGPPAGNAPQYFPSPAYAPHVPHAPHAQYAPQLYPAGYYGPPMLRARTSGVAVTGMVLGILSLLFFWAWLLGPLLSVMGIVFSAIGMSQGSKPGWTGTGMAIAGLVCSLITAVIWVFLAILIASVLA